jgi:hypothetical protein
LKGKCEDESGGLIPEGEKSVQSDLPDLGVVGDVAPMSRARPLAAFRRGEIERKIREKCPKNTRLVVI